MDRNYNELALMLNAQATHNDCNIIIPWGFISGGRDGGRLGGLIIPLSVQAFSHRYHVTIQTPNIIVVQFRSGTVTIQAVWIFNAQYFFLNEGKKYIQVHQILN